MTPKVRKIGEVWWVVSSSGSVTHGPFATKRPAQRILDNITEFGDERGER